MFRKLQWKNSSDIHTNKRNLKAVAICKFYKKEKEGKKGPKLANELRIIELDYLSYKWMQI
jgi:hypothetical protein